MHTKNVFLLNSFTLSSSVKLLIYSILLNFIDNRYCNNICFYFLITYIWTQETTNNFFLMK